MPKQAKTPASEILFAVLLAWVSASLNYRFGVGNQLEQIPLILSALDPGYLNRDFFVETGTQFGPRIYFVQLVAWFSELLPLHWVYYLLSVLANLALVLVTQWSARRLLGVDSLGASLAAVMTLGLASFHLGDATQIRYEVFQPASLAIPGALWAIGLGLAGRPVAAAAVAALASLPHPLYGVEGGAIALGSAFFAVLLRNAPDGRLAWAAAFGRTLAAAVLLGAVTALLWWLPYRDVNAGQALSNAEFFDILAGFRAPHHYYPSAFRVSDYVTASLFLAASALAFERWSRAAGALRAGLLLLPVFAVFAACLAGVLFTEIWPVRQVLTLQPFRLLSIVKWLGFMLIAWTLAAYWQRPPTAQARRLVALSLFSTGVTHPLIATATLGLIRFKPWLRSPLPESIWSAGLAVAAVGLWSLFGAPGEIVYLLVALALLGLLRSAVPGRQLLAVLTVMTLLLALSGNRGAAPWLEMAAVSPQFSLDDHRDRDAQSARDVAAHTQQDALLVAPPQFGLLRVIGRRALVVDFKSIPFQDSQMREWRERMRVVYGDVEGGGFHAARALEANYRNVDDAHLLSLAARYGASHALLYAETATQLPTVYENETYRLVSLTPR